MERNKIKKLLIKTIIIIFIVFMFSSFYELGRMQGQALGYYNAVGTEGICEMMEGTMQEDGYCDLNPNAIGYKWKIDCEWGQYKVKDEKPVRWFDHLRPSLVIMNCKIKEETK